MISTLPPAVIGFDFQSVVMKSTQPTQSSRERAQNLNFRPFLDANQTNAEMTVMRLNILTRHVQASLDPGLVVF